MPHVSIILRPSDTMTSGATFPYRFRGDSDLVVGPFVGEPCFLVGEGDLVSCTFLGDLAGDVLALLGEEGTTMSADFRGEDFWAVSLLPTAGTTIGTTFLGLVLRGEGGLEASASTRAPCFFVSTTSGSTRHESLVASKAPLSSEVDANNACARAAFFFLLS